jgi:uncharacterized protein (DUF58 family)
MTLPPVTSEECNVCHHRAIATASLLHLPLRSRVWMGQAGEFAGAGTGSSLDFQDHRLYVPGDDPRHINWQAYARTGTYSMKLYREEVRPVVDVVLDVSSSMFFDKQKACRVADLFYLCVESAQRSGASMHVHLIKGDQTRMTPYEVIASHAWWETAEKLVPKAPAMPPQMMRVPLRPNAIRILISDLLYPGEAEPILRALNQRQGSGIVLCPFLQSEVDPGWSGNCEFVDAELNTRHPHRIEPNTLQRYKAAYVQHFSLWKNSALRQQVLLARVASEVDLQRALHAEAIAIGAFETN